MSTKNLEARDVAVLALAEAVHLPRLLVLVVQHALLCMTGPHLAEVAAPERLGVRASYSFEAAALSKRSSSSCRWSKLPK